MIGCLIKKTKKMKTKPCKSCLEIEREANELKENTRISQKDLTERELMLGKKAFIHGAVWARENLGSCDCYRKDDTRFFNDY